MSSEAPQRPESAPGLKRALSAAYVLAQKLQERSPEPELLRGAERQASPAVRPQGPAPTPVRRNERIHAPRYKRSRSPAPECRLRLDKDGVRPSEAVNWPSRPDRSAHGWRRDVHTQRRP